MESLDIIIWAVLAALALVGEVLTTTFFVLFFSLGAIAGLVLALAGVGVAGQLAGFILVSVLSMVVLRPRLLNRLSLSGERYESRGQLAGKRAVVTAEIEPGGKGTVEIGGGEFWTARSLHSGERIEEGSRVRVLDTDGLTALVEPLEGTEAIEKEQA